MVDMSQIKTISDYAFNNMFSNNSSIKGLVDLSNLTTVGKWGLEGSFDNCDNITSVDLSKLTNVGFYGLLNRVPAYKQFICNCVDKIGNRGKSFLIIAAVVKRRP